MTRPVSTSGVRRPELGRLGAHRRDRVWHVYRVWHVKAGLLDHGWALPAGPGRGKAVLSESLGEPASARGTGAASRGAAAAAALAGSPSRHRGMTGRARLQAADPPDVGGHSDAGSGRCLPHRDHGRLGDGQRRPAAACSGDAAWPRDRGGPDRAGRDHDQRAGEDPGAPPPWSCPTMSARSSSRPLGCSPFLGTA